MRLFHHQNAADEIDVALTRPVVRARPSTNLKTSAPPALESLPLLPSVLCQYTLQAAPTAENGDTQGFGDGCRLGLHSIEDLRIDEEESCLQVNA